MNVFNALKVGLIKNRPEILTGLGIGGFAITTILVGKESFNFYEETRTPGFRESSKTTKFVKALKEYWPAILTGGLSIACIILGQKIQYTRTAAASAAGLIAQDSLTNFIQKTTEEFGRDKTNAIREKISSDKMEMNNFNEETIINTGNGNTLCYDAIAGRYFYSSIDSLRRAECEMNKRIRDGFVSVNEYFLELDLDPIKYGDVLGWDPNRTGYVELELFSKLSPQNEPCLVIDSTLVFNTLYS